MVDTASILYGQLENWPSQKDMAAILIKAGLQVYIGRYSIRVEDCDHFVFQEYGGDLGDPVIEADADSAEDMIEDAKLVSDALRQAGLRHRFEIYDYQENLAGYLHYNWPYQESP